MSVDDKDDYMNIPVPDLDDEGNFYRPLTKTHLTGKFGYVAVAISIIAILGQLIAVQVLRLDPSIWAYIPFLWLVAAAVALWGMFSDDRKSLDLFVLVGSVVFGTPTIILSVQLLSALHK